MIGYATVGTNDLQRAAAFYDQLFAVLGVPRAWETPRGVFWTRGGDDAIFGVCTPFDGQPARYGNGVDVGLTAPSDEVAAQAHALALKLGGTDEGAPGPRGDGAWFCAYFRDLDGNKLNIVHKR